MGDVHLLRLRARVERRPRRPGGAGSGLRPGSLVASRPQ